jgi:hypothetical protein
MPSNVTTIDLDCPPGGIRPRDLIDGVIEGTGLEVKEHPTPFFGQCRYEFSDITDEEWRERIQPIIKPRIVALYNSGTIRYGSW